MEYGISLTCRLYSRVAESLSFPSSRVPGERKLDTSESNFGKVLVYSQVTDEGTNFLQVP